MAAKRVTPPETVIPEALVDEPQASEAPEEDLTSDQTVVEVCDETIPAESIAESLINAQQPQRVIPYSEWRDQVLTTFIPDISFKIQGEILKRPTSEQLFELTKLANNHRVICLGAGAAYKHLDVNKMIYVSDMLEYLNSLIVSWED